MTIDEMIAVLQAAKEGKAIQCCSVLSVGWSDDANPRWDFRKYEYRVKPEPPMPLEVWVTFWPNGLPHSAFLNRDLAETHCPEYGAKTLFRQVMETGE